MKRRNFIIGGAAVIGAAGCSAFGSRTMTIKPMKPVPNPDILKITKSKPRGGTLPMKEIGRTGITVTRFAFGSHIPEALVPYEKERGIIIREAVNYGINLFDVYDSDLGCFQYEPMGRHLKDVINNVVISTILTPYAGRTFEQEFYRALKAFGRDYIDMVRIQIYSPKSKDLGRWDILFKFKEQGKIRAVGVPIHWMKDLDYVLDAYPLDYVILPYNFYHNLLHTGEIGADFDPLGKKLKERNIGVIVMKPFASEWFISHFIKAAKKLDKTGDISLPQAMLRYVINSGLDPDTTLSGMWCMNELYDNLPAYFNPKMSDEEKGLLDKMRTFAQIVAEGTLPDHYRFLDTWAPATASIERSALSTGEGSIHM